MERLAGLIASLRYLPFGNYTAQRQFLGEMARDIVRVRAAICRAALDRTQRWLLAGAALLRIAAARVEVAAARRVGRVGDIPFQADATRFGSSHPL